MIHDIITPEIIKQLRNEPKEITEMLLSVLRSRGNSGKQIALDLLDLEKDHEGYYLDAHGNRMSFNGDRTLKKPFTDMLLHDIHETEYKKCADDIHYFKDNFVKIKTQSGINFPDLREYQNEFIEILLPDEHENIAGKCGRQSGKTVSTGIYLVWMFIFHSDMNIGIVGNKGAQAKEFLHVVKNIFVELPIWMTPGLRVWNKGSIESEHNMRILTDVPCSDAFRGYSINLLVVDEAGFIPSTRWNEFIDSIMPSQSALAWKKNIVISTMNGMNHWYDITNGASKKHTFSVDVDTIVDGLCVNDITDCSGLLYKEEPIYSVEETTDGYTITTTIGSNGFVLYELDWTRVPRYNSKGRLLTPDEFRDGVVEKYGEMYFNQNYANEALGSSNTLISSKRLKEFTVAPIQEMMDGKLKIYKYPEKGHQYIMTVDAAKDGIDAFAVQIIDITDFNFEQVAAAKLQIDYLRMPEFLYEWCELYNMPYLIIENNEGAGQSVADQMYQTYEYENIHFDTKTDSHSKNSVKSRKPYPGFRTTSKTRRQILQTMKLFVENDKLKINDQSTISEFFQFILINNKFQADSGAHDDMIMSLSMAFVPFCNTRNFNDMKVLIKNLYTEVDESERVNLGELLTIGSFDDFTDESFLHDI